jgi:hypothetical protein
VTFRLLLILAFVLCCGPAVADDELDLLGGSASPPKAAAVPELGSSTTLQDEADAGVRATLLVNLALRRLVALEVLLSATNSAVERDATTAELVAIRQALHGALVEVGRLREDSDLRLWLTQQGLVDAPAKAPVQGPDAALVEPRTLPEDAFAALTSEIEGVAFTTGKMQALQDRLSGHTVTTAQARLLLELFSFSRDRVDALVFLHPRVQDPENFDGLLSALKFESDRASVRSQLGLDG